jgi:hypothetical protein
MLRGRRVIKRYERRGYYAARVITERYERGIVTSMPQVRGILFTPG